MNLSSVLTALKKSAPILIKLAPEVEQGITLYESFQGATSDKDKLAVIAQAVALADKQGVTLGEVASIIGSIASSL